MQVAMATESYCQGHFVILMYNTPSLVAHFTEHVKRAATPDTAVRPEHTPTTLHVITAMYILEADDTDGSQGLPRLSHVAIAT